MKQKKDMIRIKVGKKVIYIDLLISETGKVYPVLYDKNLKRINK